MRIVNTLNLPSVGTTANYVFTGFPNKQHCRGVRMVLSVPITGLGTFTGNATDLNELLNHCINAFTLSWGEGQGHFAYQAVPGSELRNIQRWLQQAEIVNNVIGTSYTATGFTFTCTVDILFENPRTINDGDHRLPGWTQMQTMKFEIARNGSATVGVSSHFTCSGALTINLMPLTTPAQIDQWVSPMSYIRITSALLDIESPEGVCVGAWEDTAPAASTTLTRFTARAGEMELHDNTPPANVNEEWTRELLPGGSNVSDTVTPLYFHQRFIALDQIPHGRIRIHQNALDVNPFKLKALVHPDYSNLGWEAARVASLTGSSVLAATKDSDQRHAPGAPSSRPIQLFPAKDANFVATAGLLGQMGNVTLSVPPAITNAAAGAMAAVPATDKVTREAVVSAFQKRVTNRVPGAVGPDGKGRGGPLGRQGIRAAFGPAFGAI